MKQRGRIKKVLMVLAVVLGLVWGLAWAETLYVQRNSVEIKQGQGAFYPTIHTAKKGEALEVVAKEGGWVQVKTPKGLGWVFGQALDAKKPGTTLASFTGTADTSELDKTAGFKGFDAGTEEAYVRTNNLKAQMAQVDAMERPAFSVAELESFQKSGRVGRYGGAR
ncbi:MAG: SH3 domain-containing protein [Thermodesulfobacteriota bacterium]